MDINTLQFYLSKAKKAKEDIKPFANEVLGFTELTYKIEDSATKNFTPNEIDSVIPQSLSNLVSFLMSSMVSRSTKWATITMNEKLYKLVNGDSDEYTSDQEIVDLNRQLEDISDVTYTYLNQSNYYSEVAKALRECVNIGTGAYRVSEKDDPLVPFIFQYIPQDDLYYWEDGYGRPVYIFKTLRDMTKRTIGLMFGDYKPTFPSELRDDDIDKITLTEVIYPSKEDNHKFVYEVYSEDFRTRVMSIELEYCPIVIFRWSKEGSNPNGLGLSMQGLKTFKELKDAKDKRKESAEKLLNPPIQVRGDRAIAQMLSLKANAINYTGTATPVQLESQVQDLFVNPIETVGSLLPLDQDIAKYENAIRELYLSNPVGAIEDYKRRSATESQIRLNALRQKYALSFEILERELLMPTFLTPLRILVKKRKIEFDVKDLDITMINYKNSLALNQDMQNVEMLISYMQSAMQAMQMATPTGLKLAKVLPYFQQNLGIPQSLAMSEEELNQLAEQQAAGQQQQNMQAEQMQQNALREQELRLEQEKFANQAARNGMV